MPAIILVDGDFISSVMLFFVCSAMLLISTFPVTCTFVRKKNIAQYPDELHLYWTILHIKKFYACQKYFKFIDSLIVPYKRVLF